MTTSEIGKTLYTTKGRVFHFLIGIVQWGNFAPFKASHIAEQLDISRQAVYKAKKELLEDKLIVEAINTTTGEKGVLITNILMQKGEENKDIVAIK